MGQIEEKSETESVKSTGANAKWIEERISSMNVNSIENSTVAGVEADNETIWYLAYGSNMNSTVLGGRRNVYPTTSKPAIVPGWYLNFDVVIPPNLPMAAREPSFASIGKKPIQDSQPELHGVLHEITKKDYSQIINTEGKSYVSQEITTNLYEEGGQGQVCSAFTLVYPPRDSESQVIYPSERYKKLLVDGASEFGLENSYQKWLEELPCFVPNQSQPQAT